MFPRLTTALGVGAVMLYFAEHAAEATMIAAGTPVIVLGKELSSEASPPPSDAIRAHLARAVELARPEHLAFAGLPRRDATRLLTSVVRLFGPAPLRDAVSALLADEDVQRAHDHVVKAALPVKLRTCLEQLLAPLPATALDNAKYTAVCHRNADRAALLLGGAASAIAADVKARGEGTQHLIRAIGHPHWMETRAKLGFGPRLAGQSFGTLRMPFRTTCALASRQIAPKYTSLVPSAKASRPSGALATARTAFPSMPMRVIVWSSLQ